MAKTDTLSASRISSERHRSLPSGPKAAPVDSFVSSIAGFRDWMPFEGRRKTAGTVSQYCESASMLAAWARGQGYESFGELKKTDLRAFLNSLHGRDGGPASESWKATVWWGIRSLFRYLEDEEDTPDIARRITVGRPQASDRVTHLDAPDVDRLLSACSTPREKAVISLMLDTGLRIAELSSLTLEDAEADLPVRRVIVRGKGGKVRAVPYSGQTALALRRYIRERSKDRHAGSPALWLGQRGPATVSGLDKMIREVGRRAGIEGLHPHLIRHTFCHHYRLNGGQTDNLVFLAGWSGPAMALRYGRSAAAERAEQEARGLSLVERSKRRLRDRRFALTPEGLWRNLQSSLAAHAAASPLPAGEQPSSSWRPTLRTAGRGSCRSAASASWSCRSPTPTAPSW